MTHKTVVNGINLFRCLGFHSVVALSNFAYPGACLDPAFQRLLTLS